MAPPKKSEGQVVLVHKAMDSKLPKWLPLGLRAWTSVRTVDDFKQAARMRSRTGVLVFKLGPFVYGVADHGAQMPPAPFPENVDQYLGGRAQDAKLGTGGTGAPPGTPPWLKPVPYDVPGMPKKRMPDTAYSGFQDGDPPHWSTVPKNYSPSPPVMIDDHGSPRWVTQNAWARFLVALRSPGRLQQGLAVTTTTTIGMAAARMAIPGVAEATEAWVTMGGRIGVESFWIANRARLLLAARGSAVAAAAVGGYVIGSYLDEEFGISDYIAYDFSGLSDHLHRLDALNGGRTNRRGSPGFLPPPPARVGSARKEFMMLLAKRAQSDFIRVGPPSLRSETSSANGAASPQKPSKKNFAGNCTSHIVAPGETLGDLALLYYGDSGMWPWIVRANEEHFNTMTPIEEYQPKPGLRLTIQAPKEYLTCVIQ